MAGIGTLVLPGAGSGLGLARTAAAPGDRCVACTRRVRRGAVVGVTDRNPAESAKPPATIRQPIPATSPDDGAKVIAEAWVRSGTLGLYLSLVVVTGVRRGELCGLQICDVDLGRGPRACFKS